MLAAHRNGGRTELRELRQGVGPLHRAHDAPAGPPSARSARCVTMLEASIAAEDARYNGDLSDAIAEHRTCSATAPGARSCTRAAGAFPQDDYERAFAALDAQQDTAEPAVEREREHARLAALRASYIASPARMNCSSGMKQFLLVRSR